MRAAFIGLLQLWAILTPLVTLVGAVTFFFRLHSSSAALALAVSLLWFYLYPPLLWRAVSRIFPLRTGMRVFGQVRQKRDSTLDSPANPSGASAGGINLTTSWMVAYQIQLIYGILPFAEKLLLIVPGAYSAWLRLWGSRIGKQVYWTPGTEIVDRTHVEVGDRVIMGQHSYLSCHVVMKRKDRYFLYFAPVKVGTGAFVGAWSILAAGTKVDDNDIVKAGDVRGFFKKEGGRTEARGKIDEMLNNERNQSQTQARNQGDERSDQLNERSKEQPGSFVRSRKDSQRPVERGLEA
jgi:hypothetical protein